MRDNTRRKCNKSQKFCPCFQNFMINQENLIRIKREGGNISNRETPIKSGWLESLLVSFDPWHVTRSPPIESWEVNKLI